MIRFDVGCLMAQHNVYDILGLEFFFQSHHSFYDGTKFVFCFHFFLWIQTVVTISTVFILKIFTEII